MKIPVRVLSDDRGSGLELVLVAGASGLGRDIVHPRVQRPGLALAGFLDSVRPDHVQVLGGTEMLYLASLEIPAQRTAVAGLCSAGPAAIIITRGIEASEPLTEVAESRSLPLFSTQLPTDVFLNRLHNLLDEHLSNETNLHGVLLDVHGVGVLLTGQSGIGKSECALDLVLRGHRLVADDVVVIRQMGRELVGSGSPLTRNHMEVRGLGIINVKELFGAASVRERKNVELLIEMVEWRAGAEYDRMGLDARFETILDTPVPKLRLPIHPGRNVASIVQVAARNHILKLQGHDAAQELQRRVESTLSAGMVPGLRNSE